MNISILILFLSQLQRFLTFTIIDLNQQYQVYNDDIDLSVQDFGVNKLLTYGIWSKYNPLSLISKIGPVGQMESKCFLIHNAASTLIQNLNLIYYDCLDDTQLKILKIIEFVDEENNQQKIEFLIDNNKYEDIWHFCQFIIQPYQKKFEVIILNQEETLLHQFLELKFPFKDKDLVLIFGSSLIVNNSQIFSIQKGQKFATFPGFLKINKPVIQRRNIDLDFETMAFEVLQGFIQCQCIQESAPQLKDWDLSSFNKFTYISENTNCDSFQFQGWLRINDIRQLQSDVTYQIFKISSNFHSVILTDQNLSPFQYLYKLSSQMHRIIFTTYSYKFPIVNIDFTDNPFLIVDQFDAFDKVQLWHKLIVNLLKNELQVSIRFYDETEPFTISRLINVVQFHQTQFKVHYGNLLDSNNNFANIQARNFVFFNCQQPINEFHCHQSCFECDGPTNQNCLSCQQESNRIYIMDLKMCTCQYGLIDTDEKCQSYSDLGFQLIKDVSISKDITCSQGYFVSGDECIQCPSNINPQRMTCLECLMNPQQWSNLPFCNQDVFINKIVETAQYDYDNYQAYYLVDFELYKCIQDICDGYSIYNLLESNEFSLGSIQNEITTPYFIYKCTESCNNCVLEDIGLICKECPEAFRLQDGKCQDVSCFPPYYMNIAGRCKKCPLKNCKYCFEYLRDDLTKSTLYHDFQTFNTDEIINVGCALCDDNYTFEFSQGICIQRKLQIQNCLRSYINLENQEICTLTSIHDFSIAPEITNCQEFIENCLQCIQTPEDNLKCIVCTIGYISSLKNGSCQKTNFSGQNFQVIAFTQESYQNGWIQLIQSFLMSFLPNQYIYPYNLNNRYEIQILKCQEGFSISSNTLGCIKDCSSECISCYENNYEPQCRTCPLNDFQQPIINQQQGKCYECPQFCKICKLRSEDEIKSSQPQFIINDNLLYTRQCIMPQQTPNVYLNTQLQIAKYCFNGDCKQILSFETVIYDCNFFNLIDVTRFYKNQIDFYNKWGLDKLILKYKFDVNDICAGYRGLNFFNQLKLEIYSLQFIKLVVNTVQYIQLISWGSININNFDSVDLQNFRLTIFKSNLEIQNNNKSVELSLTNIVIQNEEYTNLDTLFQSAIFSQIYFNNVSILETNIFNSSILNFENMKLNGSLKINELKFEKCIIQNSNLFYFLDQKFAILVENLIIQDSEFYNSFIFSINSKEKIKGKFTFNNLIIQNSKFENSTFFQNWFSMDLIISKVQLNQNIFDQSIIFSSGQNIQIQTISMENNSYQYSCFLQSIPFSEITIQIKDIQISENILVHSTLFKIKQNQQVNNVQDQVQVVLNDFNLDNNIDQSIFDMSHALFEIKCFNLIIKDFVIKNTKNVRIFYLQDTDIIQIENLIYKNYGDQNRIPIFLECQEQIYQNNQLLQVINFQQVSLQNLQITAQSTIDLSLIQIISNVQIVDQQDTSIQIRNVKFFGNVQLQQKETSFQSLLMIFSELKFVITLENLQFSENMYHSYTQEIQYASCLLFISSKAGKVEIHNLTSTNNAITNSSHTFISITSKSLLIRNMDAQNHNFLNSNIWQKYYQLNLPFVYNQDQINQIIMQTIKILNVGGVAKIETQVFSCFNSTFQNIIALKSLIFDITSQGNSNFILHEIIIQTIENNLQLQYEGSGCISILALNGQLNVDIQKVTFQNVQTRISTSIISIIPSNFKTTVIIKDIIIQNCFSLMNSIIYIKFQSQKININQIILKELQIIQQELDLLKYLNKIGPLTVEEISQIASGENALIYLSECQVEIKGLYLQGVYIYPILQLKNIHQVLLSDCFIYEIQKVSTQNLISISQTRNQQSFVQLKQITISKVTSYNLSTQNFTYNLMTKYFIRECENIQEQEIEIENLSTQTIESFLFQIKQQSTNSKSLIYFKSTSNQSRFNFQSINLFQNECFGCEKGLFYFEISNFRIINVIDLNCIENKITELGCISFQQDQFNMNRILIKDSNFISNKGGKGIGIFAINVTLAILQCKIISNKAQTKGGGLYFEQSTFLVKKTIILLNNALEGGGIFLNGNLNLNNSNFVKSFLFFNLAVQQSNNIFESPTHLSLNINSVEQLSYTLDDTNDQQRVLKLKQYTTIEQGKLCEKNYLMIPSNQQIYKYKLVLPQQNKIYFYIKEFSLQFKNSRNELILGLVNSSCIINSYQQPVNPNISMQQFENTSINYNTQKDNFDLGQLLFIFDPYLDDQKHLSISFICFSQQSNKQLRYLINAKSFMCQLGEFYSEQGCQECQSSQGFYSVTYNSTKCSIFDKSKFSKITSNSISLLNGYWRPYILSDYTDECIKTPSVCIGGSGVGDLLCSDGHTGGLCEECDIYDLRGYGQYFKNQQNLECIPCNKLKDNITALIITSIWAILSILLTLSSIDKSNKLFSSLNLTKRHSKIIFRLDQDFTSILMKMFLNNLWVFSIIFTFNLKFSFSFNIVDQTSNTSYSISNNLDCFLSQIQQIYLVYSRIIAIIILIFTQLFLVLLGYKISSSIFHRKFNHSIITNTLLYLYVSNYGGLIKMLCSVISKRIISNIEFISGDVTLYFGSDNHKKWMYQFIIPLLILLGFTIPFSLFVLLYTQRKKLHTTTFRKHICYLFNEYNTNAYYWEVIKLSLKSIVIVITTYFEANIFLKAALIGLCLLIYQILAVQHKPYILTNLNSLDLQAGQTCSIAIFIVVAKYVGDQENEEFSSVFLQVIVTLLLIRLCLPFIDLLIKAYMKKYKIALIQLIYYIFKFIGQNCSITIWVQRKLQSENQKKIKLITNMKKIRQSLLHKQKVQYMQFSSIQSPYHSQLRSEQLKM